MSVRNLRLRRYAGSRPTYESPEKPFFDGPLEALGAGGDQMGDFRYALPLKELFADKVLKFPDLLSRELR